MINYKYYLPFSEEELMLIKKKEKKRMVLELSRYGLSSVLTLYRLSDKEI